MANDMGGAGMGGSGMAARGNRLRVAVWVLAVALFLLPLVAMQFTAEVKWTGFDFLVWGVMLLVACGAYELVSRMSPNRHYRLGVGAAIATGFLVFWANAAVGMIGDGPNPYNLLFLAAIVLGAAIALLSWFRPAGMARALYATAALHGVVALVALVATTDMRGALLSLCFVLPYLFSAGLFRLAARETAAG
ncbi:MAG: hypothetical protein ACTHOC_09575 [Luteimonas sp.]